MSRNNHHTIMPRNSLQTNVSRNFLQTNVSTRHSPQINMSPTKLPPRTYSDILDDILSLFDLFEYILRLFYMLLAYFSRHKKTLNILLLGKTGHGKSATGNLILGRKEFASNCSTSSVTSEIKRGHVQFKNYTLNIIDSPGLVDTSYKENRVQELLKATDNFLKAIIMCPEGIHAFLFILKFGKRFTAEEQTALEWFRHIFGHNCFKKRGIIVFTHGDVFEEDMIEDDTPEKDFDEWYLEQTGALSDLIKECSSRCVLFNNRQKDGGKRKRQIEQLIDFTETFDESYSYFHFNQWINLREKLILELKLPQLKKQFKLKINYLNSELQKLSLLKSTTSAAFKYVEQLIENLNMEISDEDRGSGLLHKLLDESSLVGLRAVSLRIKQEEAEKKCSIQ